MLIKTNEFSRYDPIMAMIARINGNSTQVITHRDGIYEVGDFGSSSTLQDFQHYPEFGDMRGPYGVCDDVANLLTVYPELESSDRQFVVRMTPVLKSNQSSDGGWRWHKWGEYIGAHDPQHEYLYDEPNIDKVYCFHIYEKV